MPITRGLNKQERLRERSGGSSKGLSACPYVRRIQTSPSNQRMDIDTTIPIVEK